MCDVNMSPLTQENYCTWKQNIIFALRGEGCYGFIDGTEEEIDETATRRDKLDYKRRHDKALSMLFYSVEEDYRELIASCESPKEAWEILKEHFEAPTRANTIKLLDEFFSLRPEPEQSIDIFCARLKKAVSKLKDCGHPVDDLYVSFQTIRYLPEEYRSIVQSIYRWPDSQFKMENIQKELSAEEGRLKQQQRDIDSDKLFDRVVEPFHGDALSELMNGKIRQKLHDIPKNVTWGEQSSDVFEALSEDFMKPVVDSVDTLLINTSYIDLNVYTGQLDLIVDTMGTLQWIEKLKWPGLKGFTTAPKKSINFGQSRTGGFVKSFKQFSFFWILKSGHMVPADAPVTALQMLDMILSKK